MGLSAMRVRSSEFWISMETGIYTALACALALTAIVALGGTGRVLWEGFGRGIRPLQYS